MRENNIPFLLFHDTFTRSLPKSFLSLARSLFPCHATHVCVCVCVSFFRPPPIRKSNENEAGHAHCASLARMHGKEGRKKEGKRVKEVT